MLPSQSTTTETTTTTTTTTTSPETAETSPPPSAPTTPLTETTDPWEELSTGTAETSLSATFSVLQGYNRIPIYERRAQWLAEQQARREQVLHQRRTLLPRGNAADFRPNADLPFPITAQFLGTYGGGGEVAGRMRRGRKVHWSGNRDSGESGGTVVTAGMVVGMSEAEEEEEEGYEEYEEEEGASTIASPVSERSENGVQARVPLAQQQQQEEQGGFRKPALDRKTSGIPSFDSLFETKWDFGMLFWQYHSPKTSIRQTEAIPTTSSFSSPSSSLSSCVNESSIFGSMHASKATFSSYLNYLRTHRKSYSFSMLLFGCLCLAMIQNRFLTVGIPQVGCTYEGYNNTSHYATVDFPGLLSIETALEKSLASVAAAPALAGLLKQSEIAVSDLSTVVSHSDLDCRHTLAELLLKFATGAGEVAGLLLGFESIVGRALDRLDSANAQTLNHLSQHFSPSPPFYKSLLLLDSQTPHNYHQLANPHAHLSLRINTTLSTLSHSTTTILHSLQALSAQHAPIYTSIIREFTAIERAQTTLWTRARGKDYRENRELLALVGTYEEKARGYVERIMLEYVALHGELAGLAERLKKEGSVRVSACDGGVRVEEQVRAVRKMAALKESRNARMSARNRCLGGVGKSRVGGMGYHGLFTPTKTRIT
ncbi:hypothetical protein L873DRAFT_1828302 [Choiromyces venosus 120613-1]|uniref:Uncharacterized protein n=1 Tax=Choiromyces venosus 120613-1 TaxID=1336337 RepID=A0A3N4JKZ9_9PEZI|nr:hypothetical protein L873DRAFT_1828302 [Choiromyces venosus 120613-1]